MSRPRKTRLKKNKARGVRKARATRQQREGLRAAARQARLFPCPSCAGEDEDCDPGCGETPLSPFLPLPTGVSRGQGLL